MHSRIGFSPYSDQVLLLEANYTVPHGSVVVIHFCFLCRQCTFITQAGCDLSLFVVPFDSHVGIHFRNILKLNS